MIQPVKLTSFLVSMYDKRIAGIVIHVHPSWPQAWLMLPTPFLPPRTAIVFRVGIIDVGGKALDGVFEGGEEWRFRVPGRKGLV